SNFNIYKKFNKRVCHIIKINTTLSIVQKEKFFFEIFDKLSQNFIELLNDKDDYNVIIEVENKEKSFTAHSNILKYRTPYFRKELENIQPNEKNIKIITKPSISSKIFDVILK